MKSLSRKIKLGIDFFFSAKLIELFDESGANTESKPNCRRPFLNLIAWLLDNNKYLSISTCQFSAISREQIVHSELRYEILMTAFPNPFANADAFLKFQFHFFLFKLLMHPLAYTFMFRNCISVYNFDGNGKKKGKLSYLSTMVRLFEHLYLH